MERRAFVAELRAEPETEEGGRKLRGYAAVFNLLSGDLGGFREQIAPGAFKETLREGADVRALFNHDPSMVLGRNTAGTLTLAEDERGLLMEVTLPETSYAGDVYELVRRGDVDQMSFAFTVRSEGQRWEGGGGDAPPVRTLTGVDLYDVSVVTYPAYEATTVAARTLSDARQWARTLELARLNDHGQGADQIAGGGAGQGRSAERARVLRLLEAGR